MVLGISGDHPTVLCRDPHTSGLESLRDDDFLLQFWQCMITLLYISDPPIVTALASIEVLPGSRVELWCSVLTETPAKVQWIMDRRTLGPVLTRIGSANVTYIIASITSKDQGPYTCFASNVGGTASASTTVNVKGKTFVITCYSDNHMPHDNASTNLKLQHLHEQSPRYLKF